MFLFSGKNLKHELYFSLKKSFSKEILVNAVNPTW